MLLEKKKTRLYEQTTYHANGTVESQGKVQFNDDLLDFLRINWWKVYDESGKLIREEEYLFGKVKNEKTY